MKISCGTDIIEIDSIKSCIEDIGDKFLNTIFTEKEIEYCESRKSNKYQHYAARFAAKEAIFKAISTRFGPLSNWKDFEVLNDEHGKPKVFINAQIPNLEDIDISISHCKLYAVANVIAIYKEN